MRLMLLLILTGCIKDALVPCGDKLCALDQVCTAIGCATPEEVDACAGMPDGMACLDNGICRHGVCDPIVCGDGHLTGPEVCDDRNQRAGDGCSADCLSNETCGNGVVDGIRHEQCDEGLAGLSRDGCTSTCQVEPSSWFGANLQYPSLRLAQGTVYDEARSEIVVFGGI